MVNEEQPLGKIAYVNVWDLVKFFRSDDSSLERFGDLYYGAVISTEIIYDLMKLLYGPKNG